MIENLKCGWLSMGRKLPVNPAMLARQRERGIISFLVCLIMSAATFAKTGSADSLKFAYFRIIRLISLGSGAAQFSILSVAHRIQKPDWGAKEVRRSLIRQNPPKSAKIRQNPPSPGFWWGDFFVWSRSEAQDCRSKRKSRLPWRVSLVIVPALPIILAQFLTARSLLIKVVWRRLTGVR